MALSKERPFYRATFRLLNQLIPLSQVLEYLTTVIDLFDRKVIGWSFSCDMTDDHTTIIVLPIVTTNKSRS